MTSISISDMMVIIIIIFVLFVFPSLILFPITSFIALLVTSKVSFFTVTEYPGLRCLVGSEEYLPPLINELWYSFNESDNLNTSLFLLLVNVPPDTLNAVTWLWVPFPIYSYTTLLLLLIKFL